MAARALCSASLAELYRCLSHFSTLPTAHQLSEKLQTAGFEDATEEMVSAAYMDIDALSHQPPTPHTEEVVTECVRRLRKSGDGGESDLDKTIDPGVRIVPLSDWQGNGTPEWIIPSNIRVPGARLLFLHGGSYEYYSPSDVYRPLTSRLAAATQLPVFAVDYRLAPAHIFPAALEDALDALSWVWEHGPPDPSSSGNTEETKPNATSHMERASAVYLCGDSSGGGLSLAVIAALGLGEMAPGLPLPASLGTLHGDVGLGEEARRAVLPTALALLSSWNDLTASSSSYYTRVWNGTSLTGDPVFSDGNPKAEAAAWVENARRYGGEVPLKDPRISPLFMPPHILASWLPPTLMIVGDAEVILGETTEFAARFLEARSEVTDESAVAPRITSLPASNHVRVRAYRRMWHVFPMYTEACGQAPDATVANGAMACAQSEAGGLHHAWMAFQDIEEWFRQHPPPT